MSSYEKFRHYDIFSKLVKNNYKIVDKIDIDEIKNLIDYASSIVIKDQVIADSYETIRSTKNAYEYLNAINRLSNSSEIERQRIIKNYKEENKYYQDLNDDYGIDYYHSRTTKDLHILKSNSSILNKEDKMLFDECYYQAVVYYLKVLFTNAFNNQLLNRCYIKEILIFFAIEKYISRKMEQFFNVDCYNKKQLKNSFISYGLDYFEDLPINYQRRLLKIMNELIQYKGTDICLNKILNCFGYKNIKLFKYILAKDYKANELYFYKTESGKAVNVKKDIRIPYDKVTPPDSYWQTSKKEILKHDFNTINTKYISIDVSTDLMNNGMKLSYLVSLLYKLEQQKEKMSQHFGFVDKDISKYPISLFDTIIAIESLVLRSRNKKDFINFNNFGTIYGFGDINSNNDISKLLHEIRIELIRNKQQLKKDRRYEKLYDFFNCFVMENFNSKTIYNKEDILNMYHSDSSYYGELLRLCSYINRDCLNEKVKDKNFYLFDVLNIIKQLILKGVIDIHHIKKNYPYSYKLLGNYILYGYNDKDNSINDIITGLEYNNNIREQLFDLITSINNPSLNEECNKDNYDMDKIISIIKIIIDEKRKKVYEKLKDEKKYKEYLEDSAMDLLHYPELNSFFETFTTFNVTINKTYDLDDFMKVLNYNMGLKEELELFINETNNYNLYREYLLLWNKKFNEQANMNFFNGYETFSDFIKSRNLDLYDFITVPNTINGDNKKIKKWYMQTIFKLAEDLDMYIGDNSNLFLESNFIGLGSYIKKHVMTAIMVFKAYTIDLLDSDIILRYDNPTFETVRMFDKIDSITMNCSSSDRLDMMDICNLTVRNFTKEKINFSELVNITLVNYKTNVVDKNDKVYEELVLVDNKPVEISRSIIRKIN